MVKKIHDTQKQNYTLKVDLNVVGISLADL